MRGVLAAFVLVEAAAALGSTVGARRPRHRAARVVIASVLLLAALAAAGPVAFAGLVTVGIVTVALVKAVTQSRAGLGPRAPAGSRGSAPRLPS